MLEHSIERQLNEVEKKLFSSQTIINEISIWPLIKDILYFKFLLFTKDINNIQKPSDIYILPKYYSIKKWYYRFKYIYYVNKVKNDVKKSTHEAKFLFFDVTNSEYLDNLNGKQYSRFITPYYERIKMFYKTLMVKIPILNESRLNKLNQSIECDYVLEARKFYFLANIDKMFATKAQFVKLTQSIDEILNSNFKFESHSGELALKVFEIKFYKEIANIYFKHIKPKAVFLETFYGHPDYYGVILQARENNIKVVDIQHGNASSFMYSGYEFEKNETGCLLPNYYWTWSKLEFDHMNKQRRNNNLLKPIHLGKCEFLNDIKEDEETIKFLEHQKTKYDRVVLISFQYYYREYEFLSPIIRELQNTLFLIRFHPLDYKDNGFREHYIDLFSSHGNTEYIIATKAPLEILLRYSDLHMTIFSTVGVEALKYGLKTILLNKKYAESHFSEYVSKGAFLIFNNEIELKTLILKTTKFSQSEMEYYNQHISDEIFRMRLNELMEDF